MLRAIREIQPRWVVGENVFGLINWSGGLVFHEVQADLEAAGYEVWAYVLPACSVNAPHRRDRVWFVAYLQSGGYLKSQKFNGREKHQQDNGERVRYSTAANGESSIVTHPNSNGQYGGNSKHEINTSERREYAQRNIEQMGGDVADSQGESSRGELQQRQGRGEFGRHDSQTKQRNATNAEYIRPSGEEHGEAGPGQHTEENSGFWWSNFPTQSPICTGDDGIPRNLDGITFPKWRNESIKAAGNAIVPQVALQIFKAIEQYDYDRQTTLHRS